VVKKSAVRSRPECRCLQEQYLYGRLTVSTIEFLLFDMKSMNEKTERLKNRI
jgi:hypothetical protein